MKIPLFLFFVLLVQQLPLRLNAEDFKHREISLNASNWDISMGSNGDLLIGTGADMFDRGVVYHEIYSYEKFYKEVVEVMESGSGPNPKEGGTVGIAVRPMDPNVLYEPHMPENPNHAARTDPLHCAISFRYDATDLWNGLLKKLLPAMDAMKPEQVNDMLKYNSPFIEVEGGERFEIPKLRPRFSGTREEKVARIMTSLTPEQRVALGHPAEYPPSGKQNGRLLPSEQFERTIGKTTAGNSKDEQPAGGKQADQGLPPMAWLIPAILLPLAIFLLAMGKRKPR